MANFLANLVNRSRHSVAVLHPRPVSRFEPVAPVSIPTEIDATAAGDPPALSRDSDNPALDITENARSTLVVPGPQIYRVMRPESVAPGSDLPTVSGEPTNPIQAARPDTPQREAPPAAVRPVLRPANRTSQALDQSMLTANADPEMPVQPAPSRPVVQDRASQPLSVLRPNTNPGVIPPTLRPAQSTSQEPPWDTRRTITPGLDTPPEPTISISIGRVEVTAVPPPATPKREKQRSKAVVMSLDDYLKRREKERRT